MCRRITPVLFHYFRTAACSRRNAIHTLPSHNMWRRPAGNRQVCDAVRKDRLAPPVVISDYLVYMSAIIMIIIIIIISTMHCSSRSHLFILTHNTKAYIYVYDILITTARLIEYEKR